MEHIWQEMARDIMFVYGDLINMTEDKFACVLSDAWGGDRDASIWTIKDVLDAAKEYHDITDMEFDVARDILSDLVLSLSGTNGADILDSLIWFATEEDIDYDSNNE